MKKIISFTVVFFLIFSISVYSQKKPNLSGSWELKKEKSELPQMRGDRQMPETTLNITQKDKNIEIVTISKSTRGERTRKINLTIGAAETKIESSPMMGSRGRAGRNMPPPVVIAKANWNEDGKSLDITSKTIMNFQGQSRTMTTISSYSLSEDDKTLIEKQTRTTPRGESESKMVYEKIEK